MLREQHQTLEIIKIDYVFISTHSPEGHDFVCPHCRSTATGLKSPAISNVIHRRTWLVFAFVPTESFVSDFSFVERAHQSVAASWGEVIDEPLAKDRWALSNRFSESPARGTNVQQSQQGIGC